ncbi:MAG: type III secretion system export apparatus subunit SctS [Pseudomonadota bacterium]
MNGAQIIQHLTEALVLVLYLSLPPILVAALAGVIVGFLQALTQIQEQTLSFGIKLVAVTITLFAIAGWVGAQLESFALLIFQQFGTLTR